jgi:hypothetical protein
MMWKAWNGWGRQAPCERTERLLGSGGAAPLICTPRTDHQKRWQAESHPVLIQREVESARDAFWRKKKKKWSRNSRNADHCLNST